jgi:hypothetical protein
LLVSSVDDLDLEADEFTVNFSESCSVEILGGPRAEEQNISAEALEQAVVPVEEVEEIDIGQSRAELKRGYQAILCHTVCMTDEDHAWMKYARRKLEEIRLGEVLEKKQTDLLQYYTSL